MIRPKLLTIGGDTEIYIGESEYLTPGTYYFQVPLSMTRIHACCIGAGAQGGSDGDGSGSDMYAGGGGGGLGWKNNIEVEPGEWLAVQVGQVVGANDAKAEDGASWIKRTEDPEDGQEYGEATGDPLVAGYAPAGSSFINFTTGGTFDGDGGGNGGNGSYNTWYTNINNNLVVKSKGSGGGAGGYTARGGHGCTLNGDPTQTGGGGSGGASEVKNTLRTVAGYRGGGTGVRGKGASGASRRLNDLEYDANSAGGPGYPGSGGEDYQFGAGGAGERYGWNNSESTRAGHGAVRIIWGNQFRYPDNADITAT